MTDKRWARKEWYLFDLIENPESVVDNQPAESPARNHPSLRDAVAGDHRHFGAQSRDRDEFGSVVDEVAVDLIGNDRQLEFVGNLKRKSYWLSG